MRNQIKIISLMIAILISSCAHMPKVQFCKFKGYVTHPELDCDSKKVVRPQGLEP